MRHQAHGRLALMLSTLFAVAVAASPAQASPVGLQDVVAVADVFGRGRPSVDLRLRRLAQQEPQSKPAAQQAGPAGGSEQRSAGAPDGSAGAAKSLTGTEVQPAGQQQTNVETVELGEVNGTLCDCGDILTPGGGFPKWPLLALGAVPLFFLDDGEKTPPNFPPNTPPPPQVPEPATIFLFGSGLVALGAGARRARAARQLKVGITKGEA